jgi:hypothetical protein
LNAPEEAIGKKVRCPRCRELVPVEDEGVADRSRGRASADRPVRRPVRRDDDEDDRRPAARRRRVDDDEDEDDRPRKRKPLKKGGGAGLWIALGVAGVVLVLLVGVGVVAVVLLNGRGVGFSADPYDRVQRGMTETEVNAILGPPTMSMDMGGFGGFMGNKMSKVAVWSRNNEEAIEVIYGGDGRVDTKQRVRNNGDGRGGFPRR